MGELTQSYNLKPGSQTGKNRKGFTFIEVLISIGIFAALVGGIFSVMEASRRAWFIGDASVELRQEIIKAFICMEPELQKTTPGQISITVGNNDSSLTFKIPQAINGSIVNAGGNITWSGTITYALNATNRIVRTNGNSTSVLANNIIGLLFTRPVNTTDILQVDISAQKTSVTRRVISDAGQITVRMRN
jgi:prepilin-type N-terminal cleavage/methylation domain-containing protein